MQYVVTKIVQQQVAIDAESPQEALDKARKGEGAPITLSDNMSVSPRPTPVTAPTTVSIFGRETPPVI